MAPDTNKPLRRIRQGAAAAALAIAALATTHLAHAGRNCDGKLPTSQSVIKGIGLSEKVLAALDKSGAKVVILARAGSDLTKYNLRYSHLGYVYKSPEGTWRVLHKLNECGTAVSGIFKQGLGEFFLDDLYQYEAAWVVPTPAIQTALLATLLDKTKYGPLHNDQYSMVSYAWGQKYQQSNQWANEVLAAALEPAVRNRDQAQAWLKFKGYTPSTLNIGALTRLGGRVTQANIAFDDHPNEKRFAGQIETVTVDSIFSWLQRSGMSGPVVTLALE